MKPSTLTQRHSIHSEQDHILDVSGRIAWLAPAWQGHLWTEEHSLFPSASPAQGAMALHVYIAALDSYGQGLVVWWLEEYKTDFGK